MSTMIPRKLIAFASGVALAVPVWAAGAPSTNARSSVRIERLDRVERLEKVEKLERLEKAGKLDSAQKAELAGMIAKIRTNTQTRRDTIAEAARFDAFLAANPQIAAALDKNPNLIDNAVFMAKNPVLSAWLKDHRNVAKELESNPAEFLKAAVEVHTLASSQAFKAMSSAGITLGELARFDLFLTSHPDIANQLKSNPSLISSSAFMAKYPAFSAWLRAHPDVAKEVHNNPQVFLKLSVDLYAQLNTLGLVTLL